MHEDNKEKKSNSMFKDFKKIIKKKGGVNAARELIKESGFQLLEAGLSAVGLSVLIPAIRAGQKILRHEIRENKAMEELERTVFDADEGKTHKDIIQSVEDKLSAFVQADSLDPKEGCTIRLRKAISSSKLKGGVVNNGIIYENLKEIINPERTSKEEKQEGACVQLTLPFMDTHHTR